MKVNTKTIKKLVALMLCLVIVFSFSACSSKKLTEDNVIKTVEKAEKSLKNLNIMGIKKYFKTDDPNNGIIKIDIENIGNKKKLIELGKELFEDLEIEVESVDLENKTVTLNVTNKVLYFPTEIFVKDLNLKYSRFQFTKNLSDDKFVEETVNKYIEKIENQPVYNVPKKVTVKFEQGKRNLVLILDQESLNAITGEAIKGIKKGLN